MAPGRSLHERLVYLISRSNNAYLIIEEYDGECPYTPDQILAHSGTTWCTERMKHILVYHVIHIVPSQVYLARNLRDVSK